MKGILSIQSQVVYGHVGNNAAQFALQCLGHEVWALPTVLFSNHPGHGNFTGRASDPAELKALLAGLGTQGVMRNLRAILSGYLGARAHVPVVAEAVAAMRAHAPDALYCCDPVMGDAAKGIYVKAGLPNAIAALVPLADILTPNVFELETLTGVKIADPQTAIHAARALPVPLTLCTSVPLPDDPASLGTLAATEKEAWLVTAHRHAEAPNGTGDLFAALFLGHHLNGEAIPRALARAASSLDRILTHHVRSGGGPDMALVAAREDLSAPAHLRVRMLGI